MPRSTRLGRPLARATTRRKIKRQKRYANVACHKRGNAVRILTSPIGPHFAAAAM